MPTCVRQAWLVHPSGSTIQLDNPSAGYMCQSLDLGTPIMRTVMTNAPDQDGIIDRTAYMGARTVTAAITALTGAGAQIDAVAASFAPYMVPSIRPVLHYVLDRPGAPERTLTLRPDAYDWPIVGAAQRDIALQWIAPNPISYSPTQNSLIPTPGVVGPQVTLRTPGDVPVRPLLALTGPITSAGLNFSTQTTAGVVILLFQITFNSGYVIPAGEVVTIDCAAHTAALSSGVSVLNQLRWQYTAWPVCPINPNRTQCNISAGTGLSAATQLQITWYDGFLN
jgi:hypothetical protein